MSLFETAAREKIRFATSNGHLSVEDLWDLSLVKLNTIAKSLNRQVKQDQEEDFLLDSTEEDTLAKLQFDIVLYILNTKKAENKKKKQATERRQEKQKLLGLLAQKQDEGLLNLSAEELQKKIDEL